MPRASWSTKKYCLRSKTVRMWKEKDMGRKVVVGSGSSSRHPSSIVFKYIYIYIIVYQKRSIISSIVARRHSVRGGYPCNADISGMGDIGESVRRFGTGAGNSEVRSFWCPERWVGPGRVGGANY